MNQERIGRHGGNLPAGDGRADEREFLGRVTDGRKPPSDPRLYKAAERESAQHQSLAGGLPLQGRNDCQQVFLLAATFVMPSGRPTHATEIGPGHAIPEGQKGARERLNHLVLKRAAIERVRMGDEGQTECWDLGQVERDLNIPDRARQDHALGRGVHCGSSSRRSTMRPSRRCDSTISSMSLAST